MMNYPAAHHPDTSEELSDLIRAYTTWLLNEGDEFDYLAASVTLLDIIRFYPEKIKDNHWNELFLSLLPMTPEDITKRGWAYGDFYLRLLPLIDALALPNCPPEILATAAHSESTYYALWAAAHPNCPEDAAVYAALRWEPDEFLGQRNCG